MMRGKVLRPSLKISERLPVAMRIFAAAAKKAGITTNGTTEELFKAMELGKVAAKDILPEVAKGFQEWSRQNNALDKSLQRFSVRLGRAKFDLQTFQDQLFGEGVEGGLNFLLGGFDDLMKSSKALATILGGVFKGAVTALVLPLRLVVSAIQDVARWLGLDSNKKDTQEWIALLSKFTGVVLGLTAAFLGMKVISTVFGGISLGVTLLTSKIAGLVAVVALAVAGVNKLNEVMSPETKVVIGRQVARGVAAFGGKEATESLAAESRATRFMEDPMTALQLPILSTLRNIMFPSLAASHQFTSQTTANVKISLDSDMLKAEVENVADERQVRNQSDAFD